MKNKISIHSKSFAVLFAIAFLGAIFTHLTSRQIRRPPNPANDQDYQTVAYAPKAQANSAAEPETIIDTADWPKYTNKKYGLTFKHDAKWKVRSIKSKDGFYIIEVDPGARYDNFRVYISKDDYFALSGVPAEKTKIAGKEAWDLEGQVLGIKDDHTYFTFDMGSSLSLKPYFQAMLKTISFETAE
ncbi:MAG: hypothetical protein HYZ51_01125 [Candidatus Doudnabacteria bacterium]|nr:hypothetical protein [Candidatus Doudnabacteria bacterium]